MFSKSLGVVQPSEVAVAGLETVCWAGNSFVGVDKANAVVGQCGPATQCDSANGAGACKAIVYKYNQNSCWTSHDITLQKCASFSTKPNTWEAGRYAPCLSNLLLQNCDHLQPVEESKNSETNSLAQLRRVLGNFQTSAQKCKRSLCGNNANAHCPRPSGKGDPYGLHKALASWDGLGWAVTIHTDNGFRWHSPLVGDVAASDPAPAIANLVTQLKSTAMTLSVCRSDCCSAGGRCLQPSVLFPWVTEDERVFTPPRACKTPADVAASLARGAWRLQDWVSPVCAVPQHPAARGALSVLFVGDSTMEEQALMTAYTVGYAMHSFSRRKKPRSGDMTSFCEGAGSNYRTFDAVGTGKWQVSAFWVRYVAASSGMCVSI